MRDRDIREALHRKVLKEHHGDTNTLVLNELGLRHGACRVDIAVVNGHLHGYEIKSDADTLERLPAQVTAYGAVLDRASLVVGEKYAEKAKALLPDWWGIRVATVGPRGAINFEAVQPIRTNPSIDPVALAESAMAPRGRGDFAGAWHARAALAQTARRALPLSGRGGGAEGTARPCAADPQSACKVARSATTFVRCRFVETHTQVDRLPVATVPAAQPAI